MLLLLTGPETNEAEVYVFTFVMVCHLQYAMTWLATRSNASGLKSTILNVRLFSSAVLTEHQSFLC